MIEFKIDNVNQPDESKKTIIKLKLKQTHDRDGVLVQASLENGDSWNLFRFNSNGMFERFNFIPADIGFEIDENGYLIEQN